MQTTLILQQLKFLLPHFWI